MTSDDDDDDNSSTNNHDHPNDNNHESFSTSSVEERRKATLLGTREQWAVPKSNPGRRVKSWLKCNFSNLSSKSSTLAKSYAMNDSDSVISSSKNNKRGNEYYCSANTIDHGLRSLYTLDGFVGQYGISNADPSVSYDSGTKSHLDYCNPQKVPASLAASASYVPINYHDWLLDDTFPEESDQSQEKISEMYKMESLSSDESWLNHLKQFHEEHQIHLQQEELRWQEKQREDHHQDDEEFHRACNHATNVDTHDDCTNEDEVSFGNFHECRDGVSQEVASDEFGTLQAASNHDNDSQPVCISDNDQNVRRGLCKEKKSKYDDTASGIISITNIQSGNEQKHLRGKVNTSDDESHICQTSNTVTGNKVTEKIANTSIAVHLETARFPIEDEEVGPISLQLPVSDLKTLEGRFTRRRQEYYKSKKNESTSAKTITSEKIIKSGRSQTQGLHVIFDDLPKYYFTNDLDDTYSVLSTIPWKYVSQIWAAEKNDYQHCDNHSSSYTQQEEFESHHREFSCKTSRHSLISNSEILANLDHFDDYIVTQLSKLDTANEKISKMQLDRIQAHQNRIMKTNGNIHSLEQNLNIAQMYFERAQNSIHLARGNEEVEDGSGILGASTLLNAWDRSDQYKRLNTILEQIDMIFTKEQEVTNAIKTLDCKRTYKEHQDIMNNISLLQEMVHSQSLLGIHCLDNLRSNKRISAIMYAYFGRLHDLCEFVTVQLNYSQFNQHQHFSKKSSGVYHSIHRKFGKSLCNNNQHHHRGNIYKESLFQEYQTLLRSAIDIHTFMIKNQAPCENYKENNGLPPAPFLFQSWSKSIINALLYEAERALSIALIEPMEEGINHEPNSEYDKEFVQIDYEIKQSWGDTTKLRKLTYELLTIRFDFMIKGMNNKKDTKIEENDSGENCYFDSMPYVYHRLVALLTDVLYVHHVIVDWHRDNILFETATNGGHDDISRSSTMHCREEEKKEKDREEKTAIIAGNKIMNPTHQVQAIFHELIASKKLLWDHCENILAQFLEEYSKFSSLSKKILFMKKVTEDSLSVSSLVAENNESTLDDSLWLQDLNGLNSVFILTHQFLSIQEDFFDHPNKLRNDNTNTCGKFWFETSPPLDEHNIGNCDQNDNENGSASKERTALYKLLCDLFRKNLRCVHVEAMQSLGSMLANENWRLTPMKRLVGTAGSSGFNSKIYRNNLSVNDDDASHNKCISIKRLIFDTLSTPLKTNFCHGDFRKKRKSSYNWKIFKSDNKLKDIFLNFPTNGNPFTVRESGDCDVCDIQTSSDDHSKRNNHAIPTLHSTDKEDCDEFQSLFKLYRDCNSNSNYDISVRKILSLLSGQATSENHGTVDSNHKNSIFSSSIANGLLQWVSRLLLVIEKLPIIVGDVSLVFTSISDLYFTTVFRLCCGNAVNERIILGIDEPSSPFVFTADGNSDRYDDGNRNISNAISTTKKSASLSSLSKFENNNLSSSPFFQRSKSSKSSITPIRMKKNKSANALMPILCPEISSSLEADMCAPLSCELLETSLAKQYIQRAQSNLKDCVNLDKVDQWIKDEHCNHSNWEKSKGSTGHSIAERSKDDAVEKAARNLEKREGAIYSCLLVALVLDTACTIAKKNLCATESGYQFMEELLPLENHAKEVIIVTPTLLDISSRFSSMRAIMAKNVVQDISVLGSKWNKPILNENPNEYVDDLCYRCSQLWLNLCTSENKLPIGILKETWTNILRSGYICLLEGFSMVRFCSTEGRALMSMDLATYASNASNILPSSILQRFAGHENIVSPPSVSPMHGKKYVDTYIKVFYYPKEDVIKWIESNYMNYRLNNLSALVINANYNEHEGENNNLSLSSTSTLDLLNNVKKLYKEDG